MSNCKACTNEPDCRNRSTHMQNPKVECNNFEQKSFLIPVEWSVYSTIRVEAETLQDAINIANEKLPWTVSAMKRILSKESCFCILPEADCTAEKSGVQKCYGIRKICILCQTGRKSDGIFA